jgi:hypothetical protein
MVRSEIDLLLDELSQARQDEEEAARDVAFIEEELREAGATTEEIEKA